MTHCAFCHTSILFGGIRDGNLNFCSQTCHQKGAVVRLAERIPDEIVLAEVKRVHQGVCPRCQGKGPIDVHTSYRIWSLLLFSYWSSRPLVSCRSCGVKYQISEGLFCLLFGWWGIPWGILLTPVQVFRNVAGMVQGPDPRHPSAALTSIVATHMAARHLTENQAR